MTEVRTDFQTMTAAECRRALATTDIGRVAVSSGALPFVLPVQYVVHDDQLLLRTPGHHEVSAGIDGQVVGFEADRIDPRHGVGWSVSVTGTVHVVHGAVLDGPVHRWFADGAILALDTDVIIGHRTTV